MTQTVIVDDRQLGELLAELEQRADRGGWDQPASLWSLYEVSDPQLQPWVDSWGPTPAVRKGGYAARFMTAETRGRRGTSWPDMVRNVAHAFAFKPDDEAVALSMVQLRVPVFVGFATVSESWYVRGGFDQPTAARVFAGEVEVKDLPGAAECRMVWCVDRDDRVHSVMHTRGESAAPVQHRQARGDQTTSMRIMVDAVLDRLPEQGEQPWRQRYPTLAEALGT